MLKNSYSQTTRTFVLEHRGITSLAKDTDGSIAYYQLIRSNRFRTKSTLVDVNTGRDVLILRRRSRFRYVKINNRIDNTSEYFVYPIPGSYSFVFQYGGYNYCWHVLSDGGLSCFDTSTNAPIAHFLPRNKAKSLICSETGELTLHQGTEKMQPFLIASVFLLVNILYGSKQ
ncbi:hypothetical protein K7432_006299 [Basidiobolus ranarum]|uniref:Uncharacterized protein n=1 Tax=Basidiobolus ranarum TaxID=34480 RepID=A0ABR2WV49_9FUNG